MVDSDEVAVGSVTSRDPFGMPGTSISSSPEATDVSESMTPRCQPSALPSNYHTPTLPSCSPKPTRTVRKPQKFLETEQSAPKPPKIQRRLPTVRAHPWTSTKPSPESVSLPPTPPPDSSPKPSPEPSPEPAQMTANDFKRIVHLKLDDLLALPKAMRAAVVSAFQLKYGQHSVAISSEGVLIERGAAANQKELDDAVNITKVRTFLRVFRPVLTNLRVTVDEESDGGGGRASESVAVELKHLGGKFPALKHFSLEVVYGDGQRKRSYAADVKRMVAANPQLEWLSLDFDLPWQLLATVATACTQLHRLSIKCDVSAFYAYAAKAAAAAAARFEHVKCLELAFFDLRQMQYVPKLLTNFPFQFDALDELRLDLTHGGYGNDFAALITVNRGLRKLRLLSLMFDHEKESPLAACVEQLPALKELVMDAHAVPTDDLDALLNVDGTLQSVQLLDMSEYQCNAIWNSCDDGWICGEPMLRKTVSEGFSPRYDLKLERAPADEAARDGAQQPK